MEKKNWNTLIKFVIIILIISCCVVRYAIASTKNIEQLVKIARQYAREEGKENLSILLINKAIKTQPHNMLLYFERASILGRLGFYKEAINDFNFLLRKNAPITKYVIRRHRADCYAAIGKMKNAIVDYQYVVKVKPKKGKYWYYYAELLWFLGLKKPALNATSKGLATESHWRGHLRDLRNKILTGERITKLHLPLHN